MVYLYVALAVLAAVVVTGYLQPKWSWTGLRDDGRRPRTLWDWLGLLIIPLVIGAGGYLINQAQTSRDREGAARDAKEAKALAGDVRNAESLRAYLQQMSGLIANNKLADSADGSLRGLATSLTLTVLRQLDSKRKGQVVQFLRDAELIEAGDDANGDPRAVVDLWGANLRKANLRGAYLMGAGITSADLDSADLHGAILDGTDFTSSNLRKADLSESHYAGTEHDGYARFTDACLTDAQFNQAKLHSAYFGGAQGKNVDFSGADFDYAHFMGSKLTDIKERGTTYVDAVRPGKWDHGTPMTKQRARALCQDVRTALP